MGDRRSRNRRRRLTASQLKENNREYSERDRRAEIFNTIRSTMAARPPHT